MKKEHSSRMGKTHRNRLKSNKSKNFHDHNEIFLLEKFMKRNSEISHDDKTPKMRPFIFKETGRGLQTLRNITENECIIQIPESLLITCKKVLKNFYDIIGEFETKLSAISLLSLFILVEKSLGTQSKWYPYLKTLPTTYSVLSYCDENFIYLLPTFLKQKYLFIQASLVESFDVIYPIWFKISSKLDIRQNICFEEYKWAYFTVNTRCIYFKGPSLLNLTDENNMALAPYLDLLNHSPFVNVSCGMNEISNCYEIKTETNFTKYDQVFINYGPHDNFKLLTDYGFVIPDNPHDSIEIPLDYVLETATSQNCTNYYTKVKIAKSNFNSGLFLSRDGPSWNLEALCTILTLSKSELNDWKQIYQNLGSMNSFSKGKEFLMLLVSTKLDNFINALKKIESNHNTHSVLSNVSLILKEYISIAQHVI